MRQVEVAGLDAEDLRALAALPAQRLERGAADQVFQLAHIARPVVGQQGAVCRQAQAQPAQMQARAILLEEKTGQQQHVAAALAERRYVQRVGAEAVVEIGAQAPGLYFFGQIAVAGCQYTHIHLVLAVRADPLQLAALQHPQQLGLYAEWQLADFIEEQRAAVGQLELAAPLAVCPGERAAHMAEQFAFHQGFRQCGAVDADQRLAGARRAALDGQCHQFLAYPGFPADQHRQLTLAEQVDFFLQALHRRTVADQLAWRDLSGDLAIALRQAMLVVGTLLQAAQAFAGLHRGGGQAGHGIQLVEGDAPEAARIQGVQGQQAPRPFVDIQRATQAVMHGQLRMRAFDQAIVGIGQRAVGSETHGPAIVEQRRQARVFVETKAPAQGIGRQAAHRQRHQLLVLQAQQGDRVAGHELLQGLQQAAVALVLGHVAGQVIEQGQQNRNQGTGGHIDNLLCV